MPWRKFGRGQTGSQHTPDVLKHVALPMDRQGLTVDHAGGLLAVRVKLGGAMGCSFRAPIVFLSIAAATIAAPLTAASAATDAACKQEYAAKQAAGQVAGVSKADYVKACLARQTISADPESSARGGATDTNLATKSENPIADLTILPLNNYTTPNFAGRGTFNLFQIQPLIPFHLTPDLNLITRTVANVVRTPVPTGMTGLAPSDFSAFLTPTKETNGWLWGVGPIVQIPTITSANLGSSVWGGGPTAVAVYTGGNIVAGALTNEIWSFGGTRGPSGNSYKTFFLEPFFNYNLPDGWLLFSDPNIIANWQARGTKWTVPIGGGVGRFIHIGNLPVKLGVALFNNVVQPASGGRWVVNTVALLIF